MRGLCDERYVPVIMTIHLSRGARVGQAANGSEPGSVRTDCDTVLSALHCGGTANRLSPRGALPNVHSEIGPTN